MSESPSPSTPPNHPLTRRRWKLGKLLPFLLWSFLLFGCALGTGLEKVERVVDGDTVILSQSGISRLIGVDTPETDSPYRKEQRGGSEAAEFVEKTLRGHTVRVEFDQAEEDQFGRALVYLYLEGNLFNARLIQEGWALALLSYPFRHREWFEELEEQARREGRGLWGHRPTAPLHGNIRSHVYHLENCVHYDCSNCTFRLETHSEAAHRGFHPHRRCLRDSLTLP